MNKIPYTFSTNSKAFLGLTFFAYFFLRLVVIIEIKLFHIEGYTVYLLPSLLYYSLIFLALYIIFFGYRLFYTEYDDETIVYYNKLMRRSYSVSFKDVNHVKFDKTGIHFYKNQPDGEQKLMRIPFFRFGIIRAVPTNELFQKLVADPRIKVEKTFKVLPGYTKKWHFVSALYALMGICGIIICATPFCTALILFQNCR